VNYRLLNPGVPETGKFKSNSTGTLKPGDFLLLNLPKGENAVYEVAFMIWLYNQAEFAQVMRELILTARFDGKQTVWVPVSDFSGGGMGAPSRAVRTSGIAEARQPLQNR
jgi:hypothetical protein